MKKTIISTVLIILALNLFGQDASKLKHKDSFKMNLTNTRVSDEANGVRIGEYYWMSDNYKKPHGTVVQHWGSWRYKYLEDPFLLKANVERYFENYQLNTNYLAKYEKGDVIHEAQEVVNWPMLKEHYDAFGMYFNRLTIDGTQDGSIPWWSPITRSLEFRDVETNQLYNNWVVPTSSDYRQLFAMSTLAGDSYSLTPRDIRINLAAKTGTNSFAHDVRRLNENSPVNQNWFGEANGSLHFNLMPSGHIYFGNVNIPGLPPIQAKDNDLYDLFNASFFWTADKGYVTISDNELSFPQNNSGWNSLRLCKRLTPEELGYEIFYNNDEKNPKIIMLKLINGVVPPTPVGFTVLKPGYLRGFYTQYMVYYKKDEKGNGKNGTDLGFKDSDYVLMAKCVEEKGVEQSCDCSKSIYSVTDNLKVVIDGVEDIYAINKADEFNIIGQSNYPGEIKFGLFSTNGVFAYEITSKLIPNTNSYKCRLAENTAENSYVLQAYFEVKNKNGEIDKVILERKNLGSLLIDKLPLVVGSTYATKSRIVADDAFNSSHLSFIVDRKESSAKYHHLVKLEEKFKVAIGSLNLDDKSKLSEYAIGLYNSLEADGNKRVATISTGTISTRKGTFDCIISEDNPEHDDIEEGIRYIIAVYKISTNEIISRDKNGRYIDRLPLNLNEDMWSRSGLKSLSDEKANNNPLRIKLFPNPASDIVNITSDLDGEEITSIIIYDAMGRLAKQVKNSSQVDVSNLRTGIYIAKILTNKGETSITFNKK